jgi:hypothetical protein
VPEPELTTSTPSSHPGARLPHVWLEDGSSLFDRLGTGFGLLRLTEQAGTTELTTAAADLGVPLDVVGLSR